ncbi:hypothetical protein BDN72DRAFT_855951 [Pluteus cervinus]|uniref:Uncharacterized protein n=1 Tax=Pluteus cervinus TaxID=181527 RepID=A0ACD3B0I2_9AGAR|nr:hypothetical protein BDN72DRAFT_855951 [Pluteus cervinus]
MCFSQFTSLIRSHSTSTRREKADPELYNFLTRSRSRSQSKPSLSLPSRSSPVPELPENGQPLQSHPSENQLRPPSPGTKPPTRGQSRPLSSTTTATNTTITPSTPRAKRQPPTSAPVRPLPANEKSGHSPPVPTKNGIKKQKKHSLFGISLPNSRKSSASNSRPVSPSPAPPDEGAAPASDADQASITNGHDDTPRPNKFATTSISRARSTGPSANQNPIPSTSRAPLSTSSSASSRLDQFFRTQRLFSGKPASTSGKNPQRPTPSTARTTSPTLVSAPLKRIPSIQQQARLIKTPDPVTTSPSPMKLKKAETLPPLPKIVHTPATPVRPTTSPSARQKENDTTDSSQHFRPSAADEGNLVGIRMGASSSSATGKGKEKERETVGARSIRAGTSLSNRAGKHGSFDFERPGWLGSIVRSGSGGTVQTMTSATHSRSGESVGLVRDSMSVGPGMAGIGTLQREISLKRVSEEEERAKQKADQHNKHRKHQSLQPMPHQTADPVQASTSTSRTGKSSSLGKANGKRVLFSNGPSRLVGLSHGPFAFEPPVPSPTFSTGSVGSRNGDTTRKAKEAERRKEEERQRERDKKPRRDRAPVPVPAAPINPGYRSGTKGRSLDLGLGLAWAPSKVREDALLPSSTFFMKSLSGASTPAGRSPVGSFSSTHQRSNSGSGSKRRGFPSGIEEVDESGRTQGGKEVADDFRSVLDGDGYAAFKQYVHRFDAHDIPFDGPTGIVAQVEKLLNKAPSLASDERKQLLDKLLLVGIPELAFALVHATLCTPHLYTAYIRLY